MWRASLIILIALLAGCGRNPPTPQPPSTTPPITQTNLQSYQAFGVVKELEADGKSVRINHEEIPGYMLAMTMSFEVRDTNELRGIQVGDVVAFRPAEAVGLPFHIAQKKVPYVDEAGNFVEPNEPNALKFEKFIFDLLPAARKTLVVEVDPAEAFAPVKNAPGAKTDSPETVRAAILAQHARLLRKAGVAVASGVEVEISPLFAGGAAELKQKLGPQVRFEKATYLR